MKQIWEIGRSDYQRNKYDILRKAQRNVSCLTSGQLGPRFKDSQRTFVSTIIKSSVMHETVWNEGDVTKMLVQKDRVQAMDNSLVDLMGTIFYERTRETIQSYLDHKEKMIQGFRDALSLAVDSAKAPIDSGKKLPIRYIQLSYLLSGVLLKEFRLKIDLYDTRHYGDLTGGDGYWDYAELFPYVDEDIDRLKEEWEQQFLHIREYEVVDLRLRYSVGVFAILEKILRDMVSEEAFGPVLEGMMEPEAAVFYGAYLDQSAVIATMKRSS